MGKKIQLKRGEKKDLPLLATAEIGFTTDTEETYVGTNNKNIKLLDEKDESKIKQDISSLSKSFYYQGLELSRHRDEISLTDYYIVRIPHKDENGNIIKLKRGFAKDIVDTGFTETARSFSQRHNTTLTINASIFNTTTFKLRDTQIVDGEVIGTGSSPLRHILGIKADNTLVTYPPGTPPETIIADGCTDALTAFIPLLLNGDIADPELILGYDPNSDPHPRQIICQFDNKDLMILSCDGRKANNPGMSCNDLIRILKSYGVSFAFMLDGGGSTQTIHKNTLLNRSVDDGGYTEREVPDFLYIAKEMNQERDKDILSLNIDMGELAKQVADLMLSVDEKIDFNLGYMRLRGPQGYTSQGIESWEGLNKNTKLYLTKDFISYYDYGKERNFFKVFSNGDISTPKGTLGSFFKNSTSVFNLNTVSESGTYWIIPSTTGNPTGDISWSVLHFNTGEDNAMQVAYPFHETLYGSRFRVKKNGKWEAWRSSGG